MQTAAKSVQPRDVTTRSTFLNTPEAAEFLGTSPGTLVVWRCTKRYDLPYIKLGHLVKYDLADLEAFVESRKVRK